MKRELPRSISAGVIVAAAIALNIIIPPETSRLAFLLGFGIGLCAVAMVANIRALIRCERRREILDNMDWLRENHPDNLTVQSLQLHITHGWIDTPWGEKPVRELARATRKRLEEQEETQ